MTDKEKYAIIEKEVDEMYTIFFEEERKQKFKSEIEAIEYIDNNLPEITAQDMTGYLSEAIGTSRASATAPIAYMQDSATLNSLLVGSVDAATLIDPSILDIFARGSLSLGISASSMHITSDDFYNSGSMSADSIYVASSVFINENGEILSGKSLALSGGSVANKGIA